MKRGPIGCLRRIVWNAAAASIYGPVSPFSPPMWKVRVSSCSLHLHLEALNTRKALSEVPKCSPESSAQLVVVHIWFRLPFAPFLCHLVCGRKEKGRQFVRLSCCPICKLCMLPGSVSLNSPFVPSQVMTDAFEESASISSRNCHNWICPDPWATSRWEAAFRSW